MKRVATGFTDATIKKFKNKITFLVDERDMLLKFALTLQKHTLKIYLQNTNSITINLLILIR